MSDKTTDKPSEPQKSSGGTGSPPDASKAGTTPPVPSGEGAGDKSSGDKGQESFPRSYVEELRRESAGYRDRAKTADELGRRLVTAYAESTGKLINPDDLPYAETLLGDDKLPDRTKVEQAVDDLLRLRPYLASRRPPVADVGQGQRDEGTDTLTFGSLLRSGVG